MSPVVSPRTLQIKSAVQGTTKIKSAVQASDPKLGGFNLAVFFLEGGFSQSTTPSPSAENYHPWFRWACLVGGKYP
eukprot:6187868-Pleurochrysis_carterae.AAC.1